MLATMLDDNPTLATSDVRTFEAPGGCLITAAALPDAHDEWAIITNGVCLGYAKADRVALYQVYDAQQQRLFSVAMGDTALADIGQKLAYSANMAPDKNGRWRVETCAIIKVEQPVHWKVAERPYRFAPQQPHLIQPDSLVSEGQMRAIDRWVAANPEIGFCHRNHGCPILGFETRGAMMGFLLVWQGKIIPRAEAA